MTENKRENMVKTLSLSVSFQFSGSKYECGKNECFVKEAKPKNEYVMNCICEADGEINYCFRVVFKDAEGKNIAKKYIECGKSFSSPEGTESFSIEVFAESFKKSSLNVSRVTVEDLGEVKKRRVTLAAAAISYNETQRTLKLNLEENLEAIDEAAKEKPDIILLTECFYDRNVFDDNEKKCEPLEINHRVITILRERAVKYNTYIAFSVILRNENGNLSNSGIIIGRNGETVGEYKKTHLTIHEHDMMFEPGFEIPVFELDFGRVGFAICWDLFFPELTRILQLKGVELILNPSAGYKKGRIIERACETGAYILSSGVHKSSDTCIVAPTGEFIMCGEKNKKYISATVDLSEEFYIPWLSTSSSAVMENVFRYERVPELYKERGSKYEH